MASPHRIVLTGGIQFNEMMLVLVVVFQNSVYSPSKFCIASQTMRFVFYQVVAPSLGSKEAFYKGAISPASPLFYLRPNQYFGQRFIL